MKLKSLQIYSSGSHGLECDQLFFAENITHLYGPNGSGKTPLIKSIAFCLGYPSVFRKDIYERCSKVSLEIEVRSRTWRIERQYFRKGFDAEVIDSDGFTQRFLSESEFSEFLFETLGLAYPNLVSNKGELVRPFSSTLLPLIFTDQDKGYAGVYCAPSNFIRDQFAEMIRLGFSLPPKNPFDQKKGLIEIKHRLDFLDREVQKKNEQLKTARHELEESGRSREAITDEIQSLESELNSITSHNSVKTDSIRAFDNMISQQVTQVRLLESQLAEISKRRRSISVMVNEINSEADTLSLNETSRQIFLSFEEVCANPSCGLFAASSDSYAKNLLYLKDQIKDLTRNDAAYASEEDKISSEIATYKESVKKLLDERENQEDNDGMGALVASISTLKDRIFQLQIQLSDYDRVSKIERAYLDALAKRDSALETYESFKSPKSSTAGFARIQADLRRSFLTWLETLNTPSNVSRDITFRNEFEPVMGEETIAQLSGSTRVRVVLAFHAALIESLVHADSPLRLLVLDTPKQHEINNEDLDRYFRRLKGVCSQGNVQVIFSTTEYSYLGNKDDVTWRPLYVGEDQKMFLRSLPNY